YLATKPDAALMEQVLIGGDLSKLTSEQRVAYYKAVCESVSLNPLTKPFDYLSLNGKLVLYAKRDAADQLRRRDGVSVALTDRSLVNDVYVVTARATTPDGRVDESTGAVFIGGLRGDALANAMMKAETKAKRRVTLSICGLGWLDETEVETIPQARTVVVAETGEIVQGTVKQPELVRQAADDPDVLEKARAYFAATDDDSEPISDKQVQLLASKLGEAIRGDATDRHLFLEQVLGVSSTSELGKKQASKMLEFLLDGYNLKPESVAKVQALMRQARLAQGQQELELGRTLAAPEDMLANMRAG
ncbi:MAG TPA: hypothetical protein VM537_20040, partial [Anaerolineae bacterium]|nr:hypothetical protein [Anaerolineae bacterium]